MSSRSMPIGVSADERTSEGQLAGTGVSFSGPRKGPVHSDTPLTPTGRADWEASRFFNAAAAVFGPVALAAELDLDDAMVSKMRSGAKSTPLRALLPLLKDEAAALALLTAMARYAGLAPPTRVRKVTREEVEASTAQAVRRVSTLWKMLRREVADELGTDEDDVEAAFAAAGGK